MAGQAGVKVVTGDFNKDGATDLALTGVAGWTTMPVALSNKDGSFTESFPSVGDWGGWATASGATLLSAVMPPMAAPASV